MRAIWSGALSFGLVNIPVKMYSGTAGTELDLDMLHKKDLSPIRFARICKAEGKEVPFKDIVKGFKYKSGKYVVLTEEDMKRAHARKTQTIDIQDFAKETEIDPVYYEKPYFLEPEKGAEKAYSLLREALKKSKKVGIATFVMHNREHLAAVRAYDGLIVVEQLRFKDEIKKPSDIKAPEVKVKSSELSMATALIERLTKNFKPDQYRDTYTKEIKKIIAAKGKGKPIPEAEEAPDTSHVSDIMKLLKESLEKEQVH